MVEHEVCVQGGEDDAHLDRRPHRSQGIVLVDLGHAEDRHHRVADELLDRAAVAFDRGSHRREEPLQT